MNGYIVFDRKTGAFDGIYLNKASAQVAFESLSRRIPQADWVLQEHKGEAPPDSDFWVNIYEKEVYKDIPNE
jgi:hypothetical protein